MKSVQSRLLPLAIGLLLTAPLPLLPADPVPAEPAEESELERAYLILAEVMRELENRGFYRMTRDEIFRSILRAIPDAVPHEYRGLVPSADGLRADDLLDTLDQAILDLQATEDPDMQPVELISRVIDRFLKADLDIYSEFVSPSLADAIAARDATLLVGVGINLEESNDGVLRCYPYPGHSADLEGVEPGDRLLAVDGRAVAGHSRHKVAEWFYGADGSSVAVRLLDPEGVERHMTMQRRLLQPPRVEVIEDAGGSVIRIRRFHRDTPRDLQRIMANMPSGRRLIFDLRGCQGGTLEAAIRSVSLFLPKGSHIADIRSKDGIERHQSSTDNPYKASRLVLLQDAGTASAAEVFIAALIGNREINAVNQGARTYGKGTVQTRIPLEHGGLLTITTQTITGPGEMNWEEVGIESKSSASEPRN